MHGYSGFKNREELRDMLCETIHQPDGERELINSTQYENPNIIRIISYELAKMNHVDLAKKCLKPLLENSVLNADDWLLYASLLMHHRGLARTAGFYSEALDAFRKISAFAPNNISAWVNIGLYWLDSLEDPSVWREEAIYSLQKAIDLDRHCLIAIYALGVAYEACGRRDEAVGAYYEVFRQDPNHSAARLRLLFPDNWRFLTQKQRKSIESFRNKRVDLHDIEIDRSSDPKSAGEIFNQFGFVIIRHVFPKKRLDLLRKIDSAKNLKKRCAIDGCNMWRMDNIDHNLRDKVRKLLADVGLPEYLEAMMKFNALGWDAVEHYAWHIQYRAGNLSPTPPHQDFPVLCSWSDFLTCWFSSVDCGDMHVPGLKIYTDHFEHPIHFKRQFPNAPACLPEDYVHEHLSERYIIPKMNAGDLLVFGPKIFHETEALQQGEAYRLSYDVRYKSGLSAWSNGLFLRENRTGNGFVSIKTKVLPFGR